jgi:ComF family protein
MTGKGSARLRSLAGPLLEAVFPGRCLLCARWLTGREPGGAPLCGTCRDGLEPPGGDQCSRCGMPLVSEQGLCVRCRTADYAFDSSIALFVNGGQAKELLRALKFGGRRRLAVFFAERAAAALREAGRLLPVVPVPPRPGRKGPDTAELVARRLEHGQGMAVRRVLRRAAGVQQKSLSFPQRKENLSGKISLARGAAVPPAVVVLDDVFTTGATLDACARVLRGAGCARVYGLTLVIEE